MHVILKMHSIDLEKTLLSRQKLDHKHIKSYSSTQNPAHPNQTTVSKFLGSPFPTSFGAVEHILELFQVIASPLVFFILMALWLRIIADITAIHLVTLGRYQPITSTLLYI